MIPIIKCISHPINKIVPIVSESISGGFIIGIPSLEAIVIITLMAIVPMIPEKMVLTNLFFMTYRISIQVIK